MMAYETPYHLPVRAIPACDAMSAAQRLRPRIAAKARVKTAAPQRSETRSAEERATFAIANRAEPSSGRAARIAKEQEMAALCQRRASKWADAIRDGLDPDIARFIRSQAEAWQFLATSCALSAREALGARADAE